MAGQRSETELHDAQKATVLTKMWKEWNDEGNEYTITIMPEYVIDDKNSDTDIVKALDGFEITVSGTGKVTSWKSIPAAN